MVRISLGTLLTTVSIGAGSLVDIVHLHYLVQESTSHHWHDHATSVSKTIFNIGFNSKQHLKKIRDDDEVCSAKNIVSEKNNEVFRARLNPAMSAPGNNWSSMIQKNQYLHRNHVNFCLGPYLDDNEREPDITVGGGLYANTDYYLPWHFQRPWYNPEDDFGSFKYYHFGQIKSVGSDRLDLTPNLVSDHGSTGLDYKIDSKLFFTELLNNLLDDWYWKTFKKSLWNMPDDASILSRVNQDWDFWTKNYSDWMQLKFRVEYNEITHVPIKWIPIFSGVLGSVAFGPFIGWTISKLSERTSFSNKSVHQIISFISKPLTMSFWIKLFNSLFGTSNQYGSHPKGVLLDFINKYHEWPSTLHLDNFDFYLPLASLIAGEHQLDFHNASLQLSLHTTAIREGVHLLALKDAFESLDQKWFGTKEFPLSLDMDISDYADGDRELVENMLSNELSWFFPILRYELHDYFSLSHTKLKYHESTEATLYFNCPEEGVSFQRTIWIEGHRDCNT